MLRVQLILLSFFIQQVLFAQSHPIAFISNSEAAYVKAKLNTSPLLSTSFQTIKASVDSFVGKDVDVPFPKDAAGGYTHDKHKQNYTLMFNSGLLFNITGNVKYAQLVKAMLLKYAALNPTLKNHPQATSASPGRLFWQALNDANWMVYAGLAYDLVYNSLTKEERNKIEIGAFKPEVDYLTIDLKDWFDRLHNHSVWACAGVGIIGIASNNQHYIDMALKGSNKNSQAGFIAQLNNLFSPDGYYTEGPYYVRYAILPYMLFANALQNANPSLNIFKHRNNILQKALVTCLQQTNTNGTFFPLNDALKEKDFTTNEIVTAINIAWKAYGANESFLIVANKQGRVGLTKAGAEISEAIKLGGAKNKSFPYKTWESTDGITGKEGGIAILRNGEAENLSSLILKYASQGLGHGHFDRLNINFFDKGNEVLTDYGSARFIGVEQKYGGRYLPENTSYAAQSIAHNTLVVDEQSHFNADGDEAQKSHSTKVFSNFDNPNVLAVSAKEVNAYKDVQMQRSIYFLQLPQKGKCIVDLFKATSATDHQYDFPFQFNGQLISTNFKYSANTKELLTLGKKNGYQFLWKEAETQAFDTTTQFTFLNGRSFYTISSLISDTSKLYFTRTGANDPNFNLRRESAFVIRVKSSNKLFVNIIEPHGNYDAVNEFSTGAYSAVKQIKVLFEDADYTVVECLFDGKKLQIAQCNNLVEKNKQNNVSTAVGIIKWTGQYQVLYSNQAIN
jgi:oligo-alginate lyase